ncbi:MAG: methyltransferase domain-containing protein [Dehalococcoidales bacterium]|nr:methyltransferase domain-containing protein [Dehalococcoidales bacterium]
MVSEVEHKEEKIWGVERARQYAEGHKKYAGMMYGGIIKDVGFLKTTGRFLEMGAGPGFLSVMLAQKYPDISVTAVDISPGMVEVGKEYIAENMLEGRIDYLVGDVSDRDFIQKLGKFDFVFTSFSLHDWRPLDGAIRNLWEAVGDGGILYVHDFKRQGWLRFLPVDDEGFEAMKNAYTPDEIRAVLRQLEITDYSIRCRFPFIFQSVIARK